MAWDAATADVPEKDRITYELQMMVPVLLANAVNAPDGSFSHFRSFDDPSWVNPLTADGYSFVKETQDRIASLDYFKNQMDPVRYLADRSFWSSFQDNLREAGVA
ncbi:hypothetical protein [Novipirellula artificiosorum]|uniref:Uncharacterized protein n=1 Tax=Novipirellula artificiosorum TaxID=2528016 RepID=A0A5C6DT56_9BACT|nr:hypothetical protein [Novipirellula artificiosorum]TWU39485.1 hypothetical protein Poly41_23090 [Novipirellula artificiosorum]